MMPAMKEGITMAEPPSTGTQILAKVLGSNSINCCEISYTLRWTCPVSRVETPLV